MGVALEIFAMKDVANFDPTDLGWQKYLINNKLLPPGQSVRDCKPPPSDPDLDRNPDHFQNVIDCSLT